MSTQATQTATTKELSPEMQEVAEWREHVKKCEAEVEHCKSEMKLAKANLEDAQGGLNKAIDNAIDKERQPTLFNTVGPPPSTEKGEEQATSTPVESEIIDAEFKVIPLALPHHVDLTTKYEATSQSIPDAEMSPEEKRVRLLIEDYRRDQDREPSWDKWSEFVVQVETDDGEYPAVTVLYCPGITDVVGDLFELYGPVSETRSTVDIIPHSQRPSIVPLKEWAREFAQSRHEAFAKEQRRLNRKKRDKTEGQPAEPVEQIA